MCVCVCVSARHRRRSRRPATFTDPDTDCDSAYILWRRPVFLVNLLIPSEQKQQQQQQQQRRRRRRIDSTTPPTPQTPARRRSRRAPLVDTGHPIRNCRGLILPSFPELNRVVGDYLGLRPRCPRSYLVSPSRTWLYRVSAIFFAVLPSFT